MQKTEAAKRFHKSVLDAYCDSVKYCGLREARFLKMVDDDGAVKAVKRMLGSNQFVYRVTELVNCGHPEFSAEHLVLRPEYAELFTEQERLIALNRLTRGMKMIQSH